MSREQLVSVERRIGAPANIIFDILANPARHSEIDGSGTVVAARSGESQRLELGSRFNMNMKMFVPYRMTSKVVEFIEDRLIAWAHFGGHRWRYTLEPDGDYTVVTEIFDWSCAAVPWFIEAAGYPNRHPKSMRATLERLEAAALADLT